MAVLLVLTAAAFAGPDTWFGAGATTGAAVTPGADPALVPTPSQVEVDARVAWPEVVVRVDLDYHFLANDPFAKNGLLPPTPPESALVQFGREKYHLRVGVTNPGFGLQSWDERDNYLVTYTAGWGAANGQNLGLEPGMVIGSTEVFVFGGYDLAWFAPSFGGGFTSEADSWGTWTGGFYIPSLHYGAAFSANEVYPADWLTLTAELNGGVVSDAPFGGVVLIANFTPDSPLGGAIRVDPMWGGAKAGDADHLAIDLPPLAISGSVRVNPSDWMYIGLEGKETWPTGGGDPYTTVTGILDFHVPEPDDDYSASNEAP